MDRFTTCIYKYLWQLVHSLVSLYEFCLWLRVRLIAFAVWSYDQCRSTAERAQSDCEFLQQCKQQLTKIPKHLNLIIGPENSLVNDELLTRIFNYAMHMNINCVSYYDTRYANTSKPYLTSLDKLDCPKGWKRKMIDAHHSVWFICKEKTMNGTKLFNGVNGYDSDLKNGQLSNTEHFSPEETSSLKIYEIQPQNNKSLLALICRDLFKQRHTAEVQILLQKRTLLAERISKELSNHLGNLTEPDISIIFHDDICTFGMLPWHIRFTEFHQHPNGHHFDVKTFAHILYKFSRCEQRWGK